MIIHHTWQVAVLLDNLIKLLTGLIEMVTDGAIDRRPVGAISPEFRGNPLLLNNHVNKYYIKRKQCSEGCLLTQTADGRIVRFCSSTDMGTEVIAALNILYSIQEGD